MTTVTEGSGRNPVEAKARIRKKNQITIPAEIVEELGLKTGDTVVFTVGEGNPKSVKFRLVPRSFFGLLTGVYGDTHEEIEAYIKGERESWD
ncbi:MAG: AbrB/MazE/SpoVT family DNA-binding domain-containing protein [Dehalococcoidia bacterium]|nr:AbrB/MazE/SpoVT family DNA-binding domain-containing protein [Dehalococcoidia bacterium]